MIVGSRNRPGASLPAVPLGVGRGARYPRCCNLAAPPSGRRGRRSRIAVGPLEESGDPAAAALSAVARAALRPRYEARVVRGHCCSLALQDDSAHGRTPQWRELTRMQKLRAAGVRVAVAGDNCRDPFYGYGDHDMLDTFAKALAFSTSTIRSVRPSLWRAPCPPTSWVYSTQVAASRWLARLHRNGRAKHESGYRATAKRSGRRPQRQGARPYRRGL